MELIEIIKLTLVLVSLFSLSYLLISYIIFRIKDRFRNKPYMQLATEGMNLNFEGKDRKILFGTPLMQSKKSNRFKVLNENVIPVEMSHGSSGNKNFNSQILEHYSSSQRAPMYKLRLVDPRL